LLPPANFSLQLRLQLSLLLSLCKPLSSTFIPDLICSFRHTSEPHFLNCTSNLFNFYFDCVNAMHSDTVEDFLSSPKVEKLLACTLPVDFVPNH
jgi:hypothetical protein